MVFSRRLARLTKVVQQLNSFVSDVERGDGTPRRGALPSAAPDG